MKNNVLQDTTLTFVGAGVMAEAMIKGILAQGLIEPDRVMTSDPHQPRGQELVERYGVQFVTDNRTAADFGEIVVLSVKPQVLPAVMPDLRGHLGRSALLLSIVAGARISSILHGTGHPAIVRCMPNTPAQVGKGMTVWTATPQVSQRQRQQTQTIWSALGEELFVDDESYLDMATALSGTGPAYVFLFMEALIDAGVHMGFSRRVSEQLVLQTMEGAVEIARQSSLHQAELRNMVTSPGGTSAEALYELEKGSLRTVISKAVWAAYRKSKYLGDLSEKAET
jgi:pyrroline-5-carboxylate reductase